MLARILRLCAALAIASCLTVTARAAVISGVIDGWTESGPLWRIGDGTNSVTLWWSLNTNDRGWFYGSAHTHDSDVAYAAGVSDVADIDASTLTFTSLFVGPLCDADCTGTGIGSFVVWRNISSGFFGVLRVDDIVWSGNVEGPPATLRGTWWFQTDGTGRFAPTTPTPITEPATLALLACATLFAAGALRGGRKRPG